MILCTAFFSKRCSRSYADTCWRIRKKLGSSLWNKKNSARPKRRIMGNEKIGKVKQRLAQRWLRDTFHLYSLQARIYLQRHLQRHAREMISCDVEAATTRNVKFHKRKKMCSHLKSNGEENRSLARSRMFDEKTNIDRCIWKRQHLLAVGRA